MKEADAYETLLNFFFIIKIYISECMYFVLSGQ
jgi:hypothetical protein